MSAKILLVEDDFNFGNVLKGFLEMNAYRVVLARDGEWGLESYAQGGFDLVILDVMMPKMDGFSVLKEIRSVDRQTPVFLLTARSLKEDVLHGFKIGADDYLIKPFDTEVLLLKIEAILKRSFGEVRQQDQQVFSIGKFTFDYKHRSLAAEGQEQSLTPKEAELLRLLCLHRNDLLPRTKALKLIWGDDNYFNGRSMDVFVTRLRKYLKNDSAVEITSLHGKGMQLMIAS